MSLNYQGAPRIYDFKEAERMAKSESNRIKLSRPLGKVLKKCEKGDHNFYEFCKYSKQYHDSGEEGSAVKGKITGYIVLCEDCGEIQRRR